MRTIEWENEDEEGEPIVSILPAKREVCPECDGDGRVLNPAIAQHCYSMEEFRESFPDDEDRAEYFAGGAGRYGVACGHCKGEKVVDVVDIEALTATDLALAMKYKRHLKDERDFLRIQAAERAMGA